MDGYCVGSFFAAMLAGVVLVAGTASGQDAPARSATPMLIGGGSAAGPTSERTPANEADSLLLEYDVVALGRFSFDYSQLPKDYFRLRPREVFASFDVVRIYKGGMAKTPLPVRLDSDLLTAPGEDVSSGVKRAQLWKQFSESWSRIEAEQKALEAMRGSGRIGAQDYAARADKLRLDKERANADLNSLSRQHYAGSPGGESLYEIGPGVKPGELYLLGAYRIAGDEGRYSLGRVVGTNYSWGDLRDRVVAVLDKRK